MVRNARLGPSRLSQVLAKLNAQPKLTLNTLRSLKLFYAFQNDHFGARHFVKDYLPRIRYANPTLDIRVERALEKSQHSWRPTMEVEFANGAVHTIEIQHKWSTVILKELMDLAGDASWTQWKSDAQASGQPILPGEENEGRATKAPSTGTVLPTLQAFWAAERSRPAKPEGDQKTPPSAVPQKEAITS